MANEVCVPLLPCRDIDEIAEFYAVLGFRVTYRRERPHPYLALRRDDLHLHFHGDADPETSAGSCLVQVDDVGALHRAFADGMRAAYGRVLTSGVPRLTAPRARRTTGRLTGFTVVDPCGNGIRVIGKAAPGPAGPLSRALENAVVLATVRGDPAEAAVVLDRALAEAGPPDHPASMAEALAYRAELAVLLDDPRTAEAALRRARELDVTGEDLAELAEALHARGAAQA